ncbi:MAG: DUF3396 domain-containing protein [Deltaproteobacteria bacterium]|nr:DUF3396 domain-containing protein [Myxococcales bacterium]MDP3221105.1 DUF3396 domain-containing protein [Deltaproteobacteria bacterium]
MSARARQRPGCGYLTDDPEVMVARVALGLTVYLDDAPHWAETGVPAMVSALLRMVPGATLEWLTTSTRNDWVRLSPTERDGLPQTLANAWNARGPRHLLQVRLSDDTQCMGAGFSYRELDPARGGRHGWLQLVLPYDQSPDDLLALAVELAQEHPFRCAVGGYLTTFNEWEKPAAFWCIRRWALQHLGLDVQDPDMAAWFVEQQLPSTNWLTLLGAPLLEARGVSASALQAHPWERPITVLPLERGVIVRAGERPVTGDVNDLVYPETYAEVSKALEALLPRRFARYYGGFHDGDQTLRWVRRFVEPEAWQ